MDSQQELKVPTVFVSYSWTNLEHENWVVELCKNLETNGFHVILDKWDLKRGHDKYHFMEQSVKSPEVDKVLIILDRGYTEKANNRTGGVGTETQIISPSIYEAVEQDKFIPIVRERKENGDAYIPTFLRGRMYLDFSDDKYFEEVLEELMRDIVNKPVHRRPKRGNLPKFLTQDEYRLEDDKIRFLVNGIDLVIEKKHERLPAYIKDFLEEFNESLSSFSMKLDDDSYRAIGKKIVESVDRYTPLRDSFVLFFSKIIKSGHNLDVDLLIDFFGKLTKYTQTAGGGWHNTIRFDNYRFIIHELFLTTIMLFLKEAQYDIVEDMLYSTYLVYKNDRERESRNYSIFCDYTDSIDLYYKELKGVDYISPVAALIIERVTDDADKGIITEADLLCYYIDELNFAEKSSYDNWFPVTYIYQRLSLFNFFKRLISKRYFEKVKGIYDVKTPEELVKKINDYMDKIKGGKRVAFSRSSESVVAINRLINLETIALER